MYLDLPNGEEARQEQLEFELEQIYEAIAGDDAINRYTHEEIIDRIYEMYDCYQYVVDNVYSKGKYIDKEEV